MLMDVLVERKVPIFGIGKIHDIYNGRGSTLRHDKEQRGRHAEAARDARRAEGGLVFANLVDFDMLYGHRKDVEGFAKSLEEFDVLLAPLLSAMGLTTY